ncbi:MAG: hypothetical protein ABR927_01210 [Bacteroidales bacterium]|jgi:predicted Rossmann-fold nucleotide-binding protein
MTVCVFASSSSRIDDDYATAASSLGLLLAQAKTDVVFGGGGIGLIGKKDGWHKDPRSIARI